MTGLDGPSAAARLGFSFPQPADIEEPEDGIDLFETDDDVEVQPQAIEPIATNAEVPQILGIADEHDIGRPKLLGVHSDTMVGPLSRKAASSSRSAGQETYVTTMEDRETSKNRGETDQGGILQTQDRQEEQQGQNGSNDIRASPSNQDESSFGP